MTAQIPSVPGVVSFGASQEEARESVLDALGEMLSITPHGRSGWGHDRLTSDEVGQRYLRHLEEVMQRKRTTIQDYRIMLRLHLGPYFGSTHIAKLDARDIDAYIAAKRRGGLAVKTITNHLNFAHGIFAFALKRGLVTQNAVAMKDRPPSPPADPDIRCLDRDELEALLRSSVDDALGPTDRACGSPPP